MDYDSDEDLEWNSEDEFDISMEEQKNVEKYLFIHENAGDLRFDKSKITIKDMAEFKSEEFPKQKYAWIVKLKSPCFGKSHVIYSGTGLFFNNTAISLLKNEDNEDGVIFGDVILFCQPD